MMSNCPTCGKVVDPLRARSVGVRDGKVVGYCSAECAAAAETRPTRAPAGVPKPQAAFDSGPVIEVIHEPASGVVTSAADARDEKKKDKKAAKEAAKKRKDTPVATPAVAAATAPITKPKEVAPAPAPSAVKAVKAGEATTSTKRARRDSTDAKAAWDWLDDEPADPTGSVGTTNPAETSKRGMLVLVLLLVIVGGAVLGYFLWYKPSHEGAAAAVDAPMTVGSAEGAEVAKAVDVLPERPDRTAAIERATGVLRGYLEAPTPRVRREAAAALARTKDPRALAVVRSLLDAAGRRVATNENQISSDQLEKLELARVLARAGDRDGLDVLVKSLNTQYSREVRVEAGRQLAKLGDRRAIAPLSQLMSIKTYKIGAAEQLAIMRDPDGLAILDAIRADKDSSADDKARATIALGMSGRGDMEPELDKLLAAGEFQTQAAIALAHLGKETARGKLVELLRVSSLRLSAAAALRTLAPARDLSEHLPPLEEAMAAAKDMEQINAAETILILVGDPAWSAGL